MPRHSQKLSTNISFRLDDANARELEERARRQNVSPHVYARGVLMEHLSAPLPESSERLEQHVEAARSDIHALRQDLARSVFAVLVGLRNGESLTNLDEQGIADWLRTQGLLVRPELPK